MVSQELKFRIGEYTLGKANGETLEAEQLEHWAEMVYRSVVITTVDQNIITIY